MPVDYVFLSFENIRPNSNNKYMGTANRNWEMTSGGVKIIPKVKQITKKIPRRFFKSFFVATPREIIALMMIGIWKPKPKAIDNPRTKLRNLEISVEILIESGPMVWKKLNTLGKTTAVQNITPAKNKKVPRADRDKTIFFSFSYKPGAININSWKIRNGIDNSKAKKAVSLKGTKKGEATSTAISSKSGIIKIYSERRLKKVLLNGYKQQKATTKKITDFINLCFNSRKWLSRPLDILIPLKFFHFFLIVKILFKFIYF